MKSKKGSQLFIRLQLWLIVFYLPSTSGFAQSPRQVMKEAESSSFLIKDVIYKRTKTATLHLKLLYPLTAQKKYPTIIFFFGGGWIGGSPSQFRPQAEYFAERGMIAVLADYRTYSKDKTSPFAAVMDTKSAIRYLREHATELKINPDSIVASGASAGGQLAAAADLTKLNQPGEDITISSRPDALVLFNPVFDNGPGGYGYKRIGKRYKEFSPMYNIRKGAAPAIVFFGTKDQHVPVKTTELYKHKMEAVGSRCDLFLYKGQEHGFFNYKPKSNNKNKYFYLTMKEADRFLVSLGYIKPLKNNSKISTSL